MCIYAYVYILYVYIYMCVCVYNYYVYLHLSSFNIRVCMTYEETISQDIQQNNIRETFNCYYLHCSLLNDIPIVVVNYTLQVDPQLIQAGLPSRVDLRMNAQSSGNTIDGEMTLTQGGVSLTAQAVVTVRIYYSTNL